MTAKQRHDLQFTISQLRVDKLIYAVESIAICFVVFLLLISLPLVYSYVPNLPPQTSLVLLTIAVAAIFYALIGNVMRFRTIRRLERNLLAE